MNLEEDEPLCNGLKTYDKPTHPQAVRFKKAHN